MKKLVLLALSGMLLASVTGCGSSAQAADADYIYGQIDSVSGNDIVLLLADYHEDADSGSDDTGKESEESGSERKRPDKGDMPEGFDPSKFSRSGKSDGESDESGSERKRPDKGDMPEGFDFEKFDGDMPEGFDPSKFSRGSKSDGESENSGSERKRPDKGEMPEGFDPEQFEGKMPEGFDPSKFSGEKPKRSSESEDGETPADFDASKFSKRRSGNSKYTLTGEQEELRVPVGTTVTTAAGVETDFDVLKAGDYIRCTIQTDSNGQTVITSVQIMEA